MDAERVMDVIGTQMRAAPPAGVDVAYVDGFLSRNRAGLVAQLQATLDQLQRLAARRVPEPEASPHHALLAQMGLAALPPGVDVYLFRAAEPPTEDSTGHTARWGVRYQGAERGVFDEWLSIRPEMTLTADGYRAGAGDGSPWPAGVGMPLGRSRSYRGLMRFFVPEVYDRLLPPERPIPAPPARLVYQGKKDAVATLFYPGIFGMRQEFVRKAEIQAVGEALNLSYVVQGERKEKAVQISGDERDFVVLLDGRVEIPTAPYADRSGFIVQAMYDTSSRRRFIHRLREWLRWEPTVVLGWYWQGRSGYVDQWPSWATTPLLREMELAVDEAAPKVLSAMEGAGMDGWRTNLVKLRQMVQAIRGAAPRIGDDQVRDVLLARMRAAG